MSGGIRTALAQVGPVRKKAEAKLATYLQHPGWAVMRAVGRVDLASEVAKRLPNRRPSQIVTSPTVFPDLDADVVLAALEHDGLHLGLRLPPEIVSEILSFASDQTCYGARDARYGFRYGASQEELESRFGRSFTLGTYYNTLQCPAIERLSRDRTLVEIAARYLSAPPVLQGVALWWSFPVASTSAERAMAAQMYHFDLDDYRFVKFFFYLTDVDAGHGPHVSVPGTHRKKRLRHQLRLQRRTDIEIEQAYGMERPVPIYGKAGDGFAEDTRCFHKGTPPIAGDRLVLQLEYGRKDYGIQHDERPDLLVSSSS